MNEWIGEQKWLLASYGLAGGAGRASAVGALALGLTEEEARTLRAMGAQRAGRRPHLQDLPLLALVHLARQAAVRQRVLYDVLVGLGAGLPVQLRSWGDKEGR